MVFAFSDTKDNSKEVINIIHKIRQAECMAEETYRRKVKGKN